jgi:hypothetical protein
MNYNSQNCGSPDADKAVYVGPIQICFKNGDSVVPVPAPKDAPLGSSPMWAQYKLVTSIGVCSGTYDPGVNNLLDQCTMNMFNTSYNPDNNLSMKDKKESFTNIKQNKKCKFTPKH